MSNIVLVRPSKHQFVWKCDGVVHSARCMANVYEELVSSGYVMTRARFVWKKVV
jgi:hypothetical protein